MHSYYFFNLYHFQETVAENLKRAIEKNGFDVGYVCQKAKVSPDDMKSILAGDFGNEEKYNEILFALLYVLDVMPEELIGEEKPNNIRKIREWKRLSLDTMRKRTRIQTERLEEIEAGKPADLSELRDIAYALGVGVRELTGENMFPIQVYDKPRPASEDQQDISGFCGYAGILLKGEQEYLWYPVTYRAMQNMEDTLSAGSLLCVPTLNNKLLVLNMSSVSGIVCSRGPAGSPVITEWNMSDPELGLETVIYETMPEYIARSGDGTMERFEGTELTKAVMGGAKDKYIASGCCNKAVIHYGQVTKTFTADITKNSSLPSDLNGFVLYKNMDEVCGKYHFTTTDGNLVLGLYGDMAMIELPLAMAVKGMVDDRDYEFEKQCREIGEKRSRSSKR